MNSSDSNKKYKRPKKKTQSTTNPETSRPKNHRNDVKHEPLQPLCPLLAKDSEWVDILQTSPPASESSNVSEEEAVLQLVNFTCTVTSRYIVANKVECEDGPQMRPIAIMFPDLLERDPQTLEGMLTKAMSTTEVTKHLVDLGQKANFTFMKKANRLIPPDKKWLESVSESNDSLNCSLGSEIFSECVSSDYTMDNEFPDYFITQIKARKKLTVDIQKETEELNSDGTASGINAPSEQFLAEHSVMEHLSKCHRTEKPDNIKNSK